MTRRRSPPHTFEQRLQEERLRLERDLAGLPGGAPRAGLLARIDQLQTAADMYEFLKPSDTVAPAR